MQLERLVGIVIRIYAALCIGLGSVCLLMFIAVWVAEDLLKTYEGFLPELSYQLLIWGVLQVVLGTFLLIIADGLTQLFLRKLTGSSNDG